MGTNQISVRQAVEISGLSRQAVYNAIFHRRVAAEKFDHVWVIDRDSLLKYLRAPRRKKD